MEIRTGRKTHLMVMHVLKCFEVFSDKSELVFVKTKNSPQDLKCKTSMFAFSSVAKK